MSDCVLWGGEVRNGYGLIYLGMANGRRVRVYAHRAFFMVYNGPIPRGCVVHHECRNRRCVNPRHLRALTYTEHTAEHEHESIRKAIAASVASRMERRVSRAA